MLFKLVLIFYSSANFYLVRQLARIHTPFGKKITTRLVNWHLLNT